MSEKEKSGVLKKDETWSGEIYVVNDLVVPKGVTLTIKPGTIIRVRHSRDYRKSKIKITAEGGTIKAVGNSKERIWFTSDAKKPMHYDWHGIWLQNSSNSKFDYVIVEFGEIGIIMFNSNISVTNSIIRWNAVEGVYAEYSSPVIQNNRIYQNGYHEVNGEEYNKNYIVRNNIIGPGYIGMNCEKSTTYAEGNYFIDLEECAIVGSHEGHYTIVGNKFKNVGIPPIIRLWDGATAEVRDNDYGDGHIPIPKLDYEDIKVPYELGYNPGEPQDEYLYVFPHVDETRKVVKKIKAAGHFGLALTYKDGYLWRFALPGTPGAEVAGSGAEVAKRVGKRTDFMQIDPDTGDYRRYGNDWILNPRGLTNDEEYFWVNDFSKLKIFKFKLDGKYIEIIDSFDIPEKEKGGLMGLTSDGKYLYLKSRDGKKIYKLNKEGSLVDEIILKDGIAFAFHTHIIWIDHYFWGEPASRIGIGKFTEDGKLVGKINFPAHQPFDMTWDGKYLWTIQRTCESWHDPKIYKTLILNDFLEPPPKIPLPRSAATTPPEVIYGKEVESFEAD